MLKALFTRRFNLNSLFKHILIKAPLALIALALLTSLSCGKRKPPLPPQERVRQRVEITGFQRGNQVVLSWQMPARNAGKGSVQNINRVDVYRLTEPLTSPQAISEEEFSSRSLIVATVPVEASDFGLTMSYTDTLQFAGQAARLRYAIRFVNASGQKAAFSNFFLFEPAARIAMNPTSLSTEITQEAIKLEWEEPKANVDGSTPPNILGYNVYRSPSAKEAAKLLNKTPITDTDYDDQFFEFGKEYFYFVRTVSLGTGARPTESAESNIVNVKPVDSFAPSPPAAITLAATPTTISIFFAINPEKDIAGYKIYRTTDENLDKSEWTLLTPELLTTNTFQDSRVESGMTYFYYLTATDKAGNVSTPSEIVSETVH